MIDVTILNKTAGTGFDGGHRSYGEKLAEGTEDKPVFCEFLDDGFVLESPAKLCSSGHILELRVTVTGRGIKKHYDFHAEVTDLQPAGEGRETVSLRLKKFEKREWAEFQGIFLGRQDEMDEFLKAAKG